MYRCTAPSHHFSILLQDLYEIGSDYHHIIRVKITRLESTGTSPGIWNLELGFWTLDFFYGLRMTQGYQLFPFFTLSLSTMTYGVEYKILRVTVFNFSLFDIENMKIIIIHNECTPRGAYSFWSTPLSFVY